MSPMGVPGAMREGKQRTEHLNIESINIYIPLLLKSVEFDDDVALLLSVAGLVMGPHEKPIRYEKKMLYRHDQKPA